MDNHYEALCGVTQVELEHYFAEPIANLAEKFNYTVEEMKDVLKMQSMAIILAAACLVSIILSACSMLLI